MIDLLMKDIEALIEAIDAIDGTPLGKLDVALNRIGDRASRVRRRRQDELEQISMLTLSQAQS